MIIIEAGATLTKVVHLRNSKAEEANFYPGINPNYQEDVEIIKILNEFLFDIPKETPVKYYGTGCTALQAKQKMSALIKEQFGIENIDVYSDLLAAARASAQMNAGQINILGTGSASCVYDGIEITKIIPNSGYLFGDYGSGYKLGHSLLKNYFEGKYSIQINSAIESFAGKERKEMIAYIYQGNAKSKIADFAKLVHELKDRPEIAELIQIQFDQFIEKQVILNPNHLEANQYFVGSIAHFYADELRSSLAKYNMSATKISQSPLSELCHFHLTYRE